MALILFPDPRFAVEGIVALGGELSVGNLLRAYRQGIFPWPMEGWPMPWFCPEERAILEFNELHVPRRLARLSKQSPFRFTIDRDFAGVVRACARAARPEGEGTWITPQVARAYTELHRAGYAHSVEAWEGETLVGGLYGVDAGGAFGGESMFYLRPNASKLALLHLIEHLRARGLNWLDVQVMSPHMAALGARFVGRDEFLAKLAQARRRNLKLFD